MKNFKSLLILTVILFSINILEAQENDRSFSFNIGLQNTNLYGNNFYSVIVNPDEGSFPVKQTSRNFIDVNIIYNNTIRNSKFETNLGIGYNQKGFNEDGLSSDGGSGLEGYKIKISNSYLTGIGGLSYRFYSNQKANAKIGVSLIPNINLSNNDLYNLVSLSTRMNLKLNWNLSSKISISTSPYFETALTKFNKTKLIAISSNYLPFAFGINFGIDLNH